MIDEGRKGRLALDTVLGDGLAYRLLELRLGAGAV